MLLEIGPDVGLDAAGERLVYRVAQECLHNIVKHAAATDVEVRLERVERHAVLSINDNGVGFDASDLLANPKEGHFGLRVLGDVVAGSGGELLLASAPGAGTQWQLRIPLP